MYESHLSYSACGLGTRATDRLVELVREHGPKRGLYGARITGGGGRRTVAVLVHRDACGAGIETVAKAYTLEGDFGPPQVFSGSSSGAAEFGALTLLSE